MKDGNEAPPAGSPFELAMDAPGLLADLALRPSTRHPPGPGEIEIEVRAVGLNLREVLKALGVYPVAESPIRFGGDLAGRILRVGEGVTGLAAGDCVVAHGPDTFRSHATLPAFLAARMPESLTFEAAATVPIAFLTAYYALHYLARVRAGERVLIHAAAGGVGLAAVALCKRRGAEIFATAGSEAKRRYLRGIGIEHVMDSRTLDFVDEIGRITNGEGVDVVLNSLAGEFLTASLEVLGLFGRFLEIGKRDIYDGTKIGLHPFRKGLTFFAIDLEQAPPHRGQRLLAHIMGMMERGELSPLPYHEFPVTRYKAAFRLMRRAGHIGKIVVVV